MILFDQVGSQQLLVRWFFVSEEALHVVPFVLLYCVVYTREYLFERILPCLFTTACVEYNLLLINLVNLPLYREREREAYE